ncbi:hypothetical protein C437_01745 [Haloarcula vallismortis ATCC 29715]|uniref:Uncharacterized protein n=1 Tax=Haloarcula vallismortis ATCC 29715 TaxID=662477 RepID=M0JVC7_HALVA|nr:hypothetical protein C437_01745 [Haloarcula vallismortis ATCC 29715]
MLSCYEDECGFLGDQGVVFFVFVVDLVSDFLSCQLGLVAEFLGELFQRVVFYSVLGGAGLGFWLWLLASGGAGF